MIEFTISCETFEDAMVLKEFDLVNDHIKWAEKAIQSGGRVVFERRYSNAPTDIIMVLDSEEELSHWKNRVARVVEIFLNGQS